MTIWNLGSINIDHFYAVPHIPQPGETLAATALHSGLGGKGANMAVASARAGADTRLISATGADASWAIDRLASYGVNTDHITRLSEPSGHVIITVATNGENAITLFPGANHAITLTQIETALNTARIGDWLLMQNETLLQPDAASLARQAGLKTAYAAAPFDPKATSDLLPMLDLLILNEIEANQLEQTLNRRIDTLPVPDIVVTLGADGVRHIAGGRNKHFPATPVTAVDTTGAGDTFTGYLVASLDAGEPIGTAIPLAAHAGALMVTRHGTADVIPTRSDVIAFGRDH